MAKVRRRNKSVHRRLRIFVGLALTMALLVPAALAQNPPAPTPPPSNPPSTGPSRPINPAPSISQPRQPPEELVLYLTGQIATDDGSPIPHDELVERVCDGRVRQQVHATSRGGFSMQMGSMADSFLDASADSQTAPAPPYAGTGRPSRSGLPGSACPRGIVEKEKREGWGAGGYPPSLDRRFQVYAALSVARVNGRRGGELDRGA